MKIRNYTLISFCLLTSILLSCKARPSETEIIEEEEETIPSVLTLKNIHNLEGEEMLSSITSEIKYIPLETTDESLIKNLSKIAILNNGNMVISDMQSLFLFDSTGKFIRPVSQKGNGPADYHRISALAANPITGGFFIQTNMKVIEFNAEGNYINNFTTENRPMDMVVDNEGDILLHRMNVLKSPEDTTTTWHLFRYDPSGTEIKRYADASPRLSEEGVFPMVMPIRPLYVYKGQIRFNEIGNDTIFNIGKDNMQPLTVIDLGYMSMATTPTGVDLNKAFDDINKKLILSFLTEDDHFLYMTFGWGFGGQYLYSTYNKKSGEYVNYGNGEIYNTSYGLTNDVDGGFPFYPFIITPEGTRIMWKTSDDFKSGIAERDNESTRNKYGSKFDKAREIANSLVEDDNPVLILVE